MTLLFIFKSLIFFQFLLYVSAQDERCPASFNCGYLGQISFPFTVTEHPHCGILVICDCDHKDPIHAKSILLGKPPSQQSLIVVYVKGDTFMVADEAQRKNLRSKKCQAFHNYPLPPKSPLASFYMKYNITMFKCNHSLSSIIPPKLFENHTNCSGYNIYYWLQNTVRSRGSKLPSSLAQCTAFQVAIRDIPIDDPFDFLSATITIKVQLSDDCNKCLRHQRGRCQLDIHGKFHCAKESENKRLAWKLGLGLSITLFALGILIIIRCLSRSKHVISEPHNQSRRDTYTDTIDPNRNLDPENNTVYFTIPVFSYNELEEATNNFHHDNHLGSGGFGIVYYGKLRDGREVAVKRPYEHNLRRIEQFNNEIEILARTRHTNLVSLYGYTSYHSDKLLLVYEHVPNHTVACHIHGDLARPGTLPWHIRMKIAIETASSLAYLHASDIIHRDVKTKNILLTNNFSVKVADFGLSRIFPHDITHASTAPQGTLGYVDPEYHQCYQLTSKSDVYSFGVVLIELISSKLAVDMNRHKNEINLSNLAIKKIQEGALTELVDPYLGFDSDNEVKRMIVSVAELAFQCLQRDRELRPSMDEVLNVLMRIESGKDVPEHIVEEDVHSPSPPSPDEDVDDIEIGLFQKVMPQPSPNTVVDKWDSQSTSNISSH